jgi:DNA-binding transcriptional MerR regulator
VTSSSGARPGPSRSDDDVDWPIPIAELADRVGMTPRNIRAHQSRGLLPPPIKRGRVACYGREHEAILLRIKELQQRGYNLAAIESMLSGSDTSHAAALQRLVLGPLLESDEVIVTRDELNGMFGTTRNDVRLRDALDSGLLEDLGDGRFLMASRNVLEAARSLVELGMPVLDLYQMQLEVTGATKEIARRFVETSLDCALEPYNGKPEPQHWDDVRARFDHLRDLTASMLAAVFTVNVRRASQQILADAAPDIES